MAGKNLVPLPAAEYSFFIRVSSSPILVLLLLMLYYISIEVWILEGADIK